MIKNVALWAAWEREYARHDLPALDRNLLLLDALYEHACSLGALPLPNLLAGIDMKIRLARAVNVPTTSRINRD